LQGVQAGQILAAAVFLPLAAYLPSDAFTSWGWRLPFLLSALVVVAGYLIRRNVAETPEFAAADRRGILSTQPVVQVMTESWPDILRVILMALMNVIPVVATVFGAAYAVQPGFGIGFASDVYLWIPVLGNLLAVLVIPIVGDLSDRVGRRLPIAIGAALSGLLSFAYLWAISVHSVPLAIVLSLLMWGLVYQGYNAVFPSFYPELFPTRTRVSGVAIAQNIGTALTAMLPALFVFVAPPGASRIPVTIGAITFGITLIAAAAALSARETFRVPLPKLGDPEAQPVDERDYVRAREQAIADARALKASVL
jgi:MFS family permease